MSVPQMSFYGSVMILAVLLLRKAAAERLPKAALVLLWAAAAGRLLLPWRLASPFSVYRAAQPLLALPRQIGLLAEAQPQAAAASVPAGPDALTAIWLVGASLLAVCFLASHAGSLWRYQASLPFAHPMVEPWLRRQNLRRRVRVRSSDQIASPLTYGLLHPVILLPAALQRENEETLAFVLAHELAHIRRFDLLLKWGLVAALCLHWWNPLVWLLYVLANRDIELACDEAVLRRFGRTVRGAYASTLLAMEEKRAPLMSFGAAFSQAPLKQRIVAIMKGRPTTIAGVVLAVAAVVLIAVAFGTAAPAAPQAMPFAQEAQTVVQELTLHGSKDAASSPSEEEYRKLLAALKPDGYEDLSIAEFNRRVYAVFSGEEDSFDWGTLYERVLMDLEPSDADALFLKNTVQASLTEYMARLEEVYDRQRNDPEFYGRAELLSPESEAWDQNSAIADYRFTYRILDQDRLTVGERDAFVQQVMQAAQDTLEKQMAEQGTLKDYREAFGRAAAALSNDKIEFTGCEVNTQMLMEERNEEF